MNLDMDSSCLAALDRRRFLAGSAIALAGVALGASGAWADTTAGSSERRSRSTRSAASQQAGDACTTR
jgi:hypothetical protein